MFDFWESQQFVWLSKYHKVFWIDLKLNRLSDFNVNLVKPAINGINIIYIRLHIRNFIEFNGRYS